MAVTVTASNFLTEVMQSDRPVLIDFFADWCMPCRMLAPVIDEIAQEMPGAKVCKVNIDSEPALAEQFGVMSIPTLVVVKNGKVAGQAVGMRPKKEILGMLAG